MGFRVRRALSAGDLAACAQVCLATGRYGQDGSSDFPRDPDALSRIYTTPYVVLYPSLSLVLEDESTGEVVGYCLAAENTREHFRLYEERIRPNLAALFPVTISDSTKWTERETEIHGLYHTPDYSAPSESESRFPSHLHIDLLPRARRLGFGKRMVRLQLAQLARRGSPGVHLSVAATNSTAQMFYSSLGFRELSRAGAGAAEAVFMGVELAPPPVPGPPPVRGETNVASYLAGAGVAMSCGDAVLGQTWVAVTQPAPWAVAEAWLGGTPPLSIVMATSVHERALEAEVARVPAAATVVAGIGGGVACDAAKYIAWRCGLRFVCIPTAVTVDAFVTPPAGVRFDAGAPLAQAAASALEDASPAPPLSTEVRYVGHASPDPLVADWDLIRTAPAALNVAGVGDILSIHTACWDWEDAVRAGKSEFPAAPGDIAAARAVLADTLAAARDIAACNDAGLAALVEGYMRVNALCLPAGHARVEEGSEHYLFYALEARLGRGFVHGHIVGLGVAVMAALQGNGAAEVTAAMTAMGLHFQPLHMGISRADLRGALLGLQAFVDRRPDLWHTVISHRPITEAWVDGVLDGLDF